MCTLRGGGGLCGQGFLEQGLGHGRAEAVGFGAGNDGTARVLVEPWLCRFGRTVE